MRLRRIARTWMGLLMMTVVAPTANAGGPAFTRLFAPAETAQTSYLNPAGMTRLDGPSLTGQQILGTSFSDFKVDGRTTNTGGNPRRSGAVRRDHFSGRTPRVRGECAKRHRDRD